jgi:four helix bundle protein
MRESILKKKSYNFALDCVFLYKSLTEKSKDCILSKQLLRSGTSIGALIREAEHAQSNADFINKLNIALKEANEAQYWLELLKDAEYINKNDFDIHYSLCSEILSMLVSSIKTLKNKPQTKN